MRLPTSSFYQSGTFDLESGETLQQLEIAYETWGSASRARDGAILLCHGYTNHCHAGDGGWFTNLLGSGRAVDTERYYVICSNMLGSSFGSTGPQSINPATGAPFGGDFPKITTRDMVRAQERLLEHLGIDQLHAVMGYSFGGHLTFLWGEMHPDRMTRLVPIAGTLRRHTTPAQVQAIRDHYAQCPGWNGGNYQHDPKGNGVYDALCAARLERMKLYGHGKYLEDTVEDPAKRDAILQDRAASWAAEFDANSLAIIYEAGIGSEADASKIKAPLLNVLANTDSVVDVAEGQPTVDLLSHHGVDARFLEIDTAYGHAGPMLDAHKWAEDLRRFLAA